MAGVSPAVITVIAAGSLNAQRNQQQSEDPSSSPNGPNAFERSLVWGYFGTVGVPASFGPRYTLRIYIARALLRLASLILCAIALGSTWWRVAYVPDFANAEGGPWYSTVCDLTGMCKTTMVYDDAEATLKTGQMAAVVCFILVTVTAIINRTIRRIAFFRMLSKRMRGDALLIEDGASAAETAARIRAARLRSLRAYFFVDFLTASFAVVGTATFVGQTQAWFNQYIAPQASPALSVSLSWASGLWVAIAAVVCSMLTESVTAAALFIEWRKGRAAAAAAGAGASSESHGAGDAI